MVFPELRTFQLLIFYVLHIPPIDNRSAFWYIVVGSCTAGRFGRKEKGFYTFRSSKASFLRKILEIVSLTAFKKSAIIILEEPFIRDPAFAESPAPFWNWLFFLCALCIPGVDNRIFL